MSHLLLSALVVIVSGWLYIPRLGMVEPIYESPIVDGWHEIPPSDVVHLAGTSWINTTYADIDASSSDTTAAGRIVLAGHNPGVFSQLPDVMVGDAILLAQWPELVSYEVVSIQIVDVADTSWLNPTADQRLVLVACFGDQRLIIEAMRVE